MKMKKFLGVLCAAAMLVNLTACGNGSDTAATPDDAAADVSSDAEGGGEAAVSESSAGSREITIASTNLGDFSAFGEYGGGSSSRDHIEFCLYDHLAYAPVFGSTFEDLEPQMAKSMELVDNYTCEIELYDYIHDNLGNPITAADVEWCYEYGTSTTAQPVERLASYLDYVKATGDYSVEVKIKSDYVGAMEYVLTHMPIVSQEWYENATDEERVNTPAVTGTYYIDDMLSGSYVTLKAVDDYWQTDASLQSSVSHQQYDKITYKSIPEDSVRTVAMENGEADVNTKVTGTDLEFYMNEDGTAKDGWTVSSEYRGTYMCLWFNCDESNVFSNEALRKAVAYGTDSEAFRLAAGGTATSGHTIKTFGPTVTSDYNPEWENEDYYEYDLEKAKEYLAEAGYEPGELTVRLMVLNESGRIAGCTVFQAQMAELGINVEIMPYDVALVNAYHYDCTQWDLFFDNQSTADFIVNTWSVNFNNEATDNGTVNFVKDDHLQELLENACSIHDAASVDEFHNYLKDMCYAYGLYEEVSYMTAQDKIVDIALDGTNNLSILSLGLADDYSSAVSK